MVIQIGGIVILTTSIICFTWWMTTRRKPTRKEETHGKSVRRGMTAFSTTRHFPFMRKKSNAESPLKRNAASFRHS